jgi:hypothetical protein
MQLIRGADCVARVGMFDALKAGLLIYAIFRASSCASDCIEGFGVGGAARNLGASNPSNKHPI